MRAQLYVARVAIWTSLATVAVVGIALTATVGAFASLERPELRLLPWHALGLLWLAEVLPSALLLGLPAGLGLTLLRLEEGGELRAFRQLPQAATWLPVALVGAAIPLAIVHAVVIHRTGPAARRRVRAALPLPSETKSMARLLSELASGGTGFGLSYRGLLDGALTDVAAMRWLDGHRYLALDAKRLRIRAGTPRWQLELADGNAHLGHADEPAPRQSVGFGTLTLSVAAPLAPPGPAPAEAISTASLATDLDAWLAEHARHSSDARLDALRDRWRRESRDRTAEQWTLVIATLLALAMHLVARKGIARWIAFAAPALLAVVAPEAARLGPSQAMHVASSILVATLVAWTWRNAR